MVTQTALREIRCRCGHKLGDWDGERVVIRKVGLVLRGGWHDWVCTKCGVVQDIDLRDS